MTTAGGGEVTLVIPARNAEATLPDCLEAASAGIGRDGLAGIVVVDDGSTDGTADVAARFPVERLQGRGGGAGHARNLGWRHARTPLVWFVDADCVVEPDALRWLRPHLEDPGVAGVSGSYSNRCPDSLLARLIHEEIVERHRRNPSEVDFLATYDVLYRREALAAIGGFDERYLRAEDMELACRLVSAGHRLRFEPRSRVGHFHARRLAKYLHTQAREGYWRVEVYRDHPERMGGDSYSGFADHAQPPLALLLAALAPFAWDPRAAGLALGLGLALVATALPMTARLLRARRRPDMLGFAALAPCRALARGVGLALGLLAGSARGPRPVPADAVRR